MTDIDEEALRIRLLESKLDYTLQEIRALKRHDHEEAEFARTHRKQAQAGIDHIDGGAD